MSSQACSAPRVRAPSPRLRGVGVPLLAFPAPTYACIHAQVGATRDDAHTCTPGVPHSGPREWSPSQLGSLSMEGQVAPARDLPLSFASVQWGGTDTYPWQWW